jgi:hypothetical protein
VDSVEQARTCSADRPAIRSTTTRGTSQILTPRTEQEAFSMTVWAVLPSISLPTAERFFEPEDDEAGAHLVDGCEASRARR